MKGNSTIQDPDEELVTLIKKSAREGQFHKISIRELDVIYRQGLALAHTIPQDKEFAAAVTQFKTEMWKRKIPQSIWKLMDKILLKKRIAITMGILILGVLFFRYSEEYIQGRLYRYDRFTWTVQQKSGAGWASIPWLKNLQHARDVLAKRERDRHNEDLKEELSRNTESRIEDLTDSIEDLKREQQSKEMDQDFREMNRQNEQRIRDMNQEFREGERRTEELNRRNGRRSLLE